MRTCPLFLAAALLFAAPAVAQQQMDPMSTPRLRRMVELQAQLSAGDAAQLAAYLDSTATPELLGGRTTATLAAELLATARPLGIFEIQRARRSGEYTGVATLTDPSSGRDVGELGVSIEERAPFRLVALSLSDSAVEMQPRASVAPAAFTAAMQEQTIDSIASLLERMYPAADTGRMIADHLRARFDEGAFAAATEPRAFADAVTREMQAVNGDRHLNVRLAGSGPGRRARPTAESERSANYSVSRPEVLEGNVGYLKFGMLSRDPAAIEVLGQSLRALESTDAIIIDLRGTPGGSPMMANGIISHFTEPGVPSLRVSDRYMNETYVRKTLDEVPGPRRTDVPLYVLVDSGSASAAEDVPFVLQNMGRATIVGERTAGAGRNNVLEDVGNGVVASISVSRVQDPATGREWELVGVQPDIVVPSAQALETARAHAVRERSAT